MVFNTRPYHYLNVVFYPLRFSEAKRQRQKTQVLIVVYKRILKL